MTPQNQIVEVCKLLSGQPGPDAVHVARIYRAQSEAYIKELKIKIDLLEAQLKEKENGNSVNNETDGSGSTEGN